jgi:protein-tyrosine phosphatase
MAGFVDIHSHILWGLDDGALDLDISLEMLRIAAESGTSDIVATPHSDLQFTFDPEKIAERIRELNQTPGSKPRIHTGCDFHLHFDNIGDCLEHPTKYTINHLRYLMVEFSEINIPKSLSQVFERMLNAGITPVITHPERNALLMKDQAQLVAWIHAGCLLQVTAQSFLGRFGKRARAAAADLMSRGMVHFVASDAHDPVHRPPDLRPSYEFVAAHYGADTARCLFEINPAATLTGEYVDVEMPETLTPRRRWFFF